MSYRIGNTYTDYWYWTGLNYGNTVAGGWNISRPGWITDIAVHAGGYEGNTSARLCLWANDGTLIYQSPEQIWGNGRDWRRVQNIAVRRSAGDMQVGFWRDANQPSQFSTMHGDIGQYVKVTTYTAARVPPNIVGYDIYEPDVLTADFGYVDNVAPATGLWRDTSPIGTVTTRVPVFSGTMPHQSADAAYDYTTTVQVQIWRTDTGANVYNNTFEPTATEKSQGYFLRTLVTLVPGVSYRAQFRHMDSWGVWSPFSATRLFTASAGPDQPVLSNPSGRQTALRPAEFRGTYSHPDGAAFSAAQVEVYNWNGTLRLRASGDQASGIAVTLGGDWAISNTWMTDLQWSTKYTWRARTKDINGAYSQWSPLKSFFTNAAPWIPWNLQPQGGRALATALLSCSLRDPDGDAVTRADAEVINAATGAIVFSGTMTISVSGKTASVDVSSYLTLGTNYRWRARAWDNASPSPSAYSAYMDFLYDSVPTVKLLTPSEGPHTNLAQEPNAEYDPAVVGSWWTEVNRATGKNLLTRNQSNIETDLSGLAAYGAATVTRDTLEFYEGVACVKVVTTGNVQGVTTDLIRTRIITATTNVVSSAYVKFPLNIPGYIYTRVYNSAGTFLGQVNGTFIGTGAWQRVEAPAFTRAEDFTVDILVASADAAAQTFYVDAMQIEDASVASTWEPGSTISRIDRINDGDAYTGSWTWRADVNAVSGNGHYFRSARIGLDAAFQYWLTGWFKKELTSLDASTKFSLACFDVNGAALGEILPQTLALLNNTSPTTSWQRYGGFINPIGGAAPAFPAGTTQVEIRIYPNSLSTAAQIRFDALLFERINSTRTAWHPFFDGDTKSYGPDELSYTWSGTPGNSPSTAQNAILDDYNTSIDFSYSSNAVKSSDRVIIDLWDGAAWGNVYNTLTASNRTSLNLPTNIFRNEAHYRMKIEATNANNLVGASGYAYIDVMLTGPPPLNILQSVSNIDAARVELEFEPSTTAAAEFAGIEVARELSGGGAREIVALLTDPLATSYWYEYPVSGEQYTFLVRQLKTEGTEIVAGKWTTAEARVDYEQWHIKDIEDPVNVHLKFEMLAEDAPDIAHAVDEEKLRPWGSKVDVALIGERRSRNGSLTIRLPANTASDLAEEQKRVLLSLADRRRGVCVLGLKRNFKIFAALGEISERFEDLPWSSIWTLPWREILFIEDVYLRDE